jgi:hypothetical protein
MFLRWWPPRGLIDSQSRTRRGYGTWQGAAVDCGASSGLGRRFAAQCSAAERSQLPSNTGLRM